MSLAVSIMDFMAHYRVQTIGTEVFRVIDGIQRIEDKRLVLPATLGASLIIMDELNLRQADVLQLALKAHAHLKSADLETFRATREYIRGELLNGK